MKDLAQQDIQGHDVPPPQRAPAAQGAERLFVEHAAWVGGFVRRLGLRAPEEIEDVVQETFLVVHRRGGYQPGPARPRTWLAEIAVRVVHARRRAVRRAPTPDEDAVGAAPSGGGGPLAAAEAAEALAHVQRALDTLDLDRRALFVLFELDGEPCDQLASSFGVPIGTIYSRLHAARRDFLAAYARITGARRPERVRDRP
ncbi:MAG: RNA polymerase sigma factor [Polyangiaceae bacterium]|nr:RNA polymerase sigma factor [Polyangiaceae bacterium]